MGASQSPSFGFITVTDLGGAVIIGGYLILNAMGRPLEFHCTTPVKPNRAQEILYGATLEPYLHGEQIGQALVANGQVQPDLILTDRRSVLSLREFSTMPVVYLMDRSADGSADVALRDPTLISFSTDELSFCLEARHEKDRETIQAMVLARRANWDLREPFERITDAIGELQKAA